MTNKMMPHEKVGRLVRVLGIISAVIFALVFAAIAIPVFAKPSPDHSPLMLIPILLVFGGFSTFLIKLGGALKRHSEWARIVGIIYGILLLFGFPIGTALGAYILWNLAGKWDEASDAGQASASSATGA